MDNEKFFKKGLTSDEAKKRIKEYGPNVLEKKKRISPVKIFLEQFNDFIIWVLISATILSAVMGQKADAITIVIIVVMNAILGFIQEYKTEKSLEALQNRSEEHTSELQSRQYLVCRLLLEKKNYMLTRFFEVVLWESDADFYHPLRRVQAGHR